MKQKPSKIDYGSLFDNMLDGLSYCQMIFDNKNRPVDFKYLEVSKNFEELTGLKNATGKKASEIISGIGQSNPELLEIYGRVSLTGHSERFEIYIKRLAKWFLISAYSSKKKYFTTVFQNITHRKLVEKRLEDAKTAAYNVFSDLNEEKNKLNEAKAKEEAILGSIGEGIIAIDKKGRVMLINAMAEKLLGYTNKESMGRQWDDILHYEDESGNSLPSEKEVIYNALSATVKTMPVTSDTSYYLKKDGSKFPASRTVSPIRLGGKTIGVINIFRDITSEKEVDRAKTEFVSLASHQLRTPLTGIEWLVELFLKKEKLSDKGREYLRDISFSVHRSSTLVKLLLETSRIENGSVEVHPEPLEIVGFVKKHINEYQLLCEKKKISLVFEKHPEQLIVTTDINLFEYILQNLVTNAIDYTPAAGKVEVLLEKRGDNLFIQVKDTGIGIPKNEQNRLFEKFIRASNSVLAKTDSTGLGLYIAQESAKLLGGKIWFESPTIIVKNSAGKEEGKGSTFFVELPLILTSRFVRKKSLLVKNANK